MSFQPSQSSSAKPSSMLTIGYFAAELGVDVDELGRGARLLVQGVLAVLVELARGAIHREADLLARLVTGGLDRLQDALERVFVRAEARREAALVADGGREAFLLQDALQVVEDLGAAAQRLGERLEAERDDHELLHFEAVVGVRAAVDDVHERRRQHARLRAAEVAPERQTDDARAGARRRHRDGEDRVGAELALVGRAVELEQALIDRRLIERAQADDCRTELLVDVLDGLQHALAEVALLVAVAELDRFVLAGGRAARDRTATETASSS